MEADRLGAAEISGEFREFWDRVEFSVQRSEPSSGFGVVGQPDIAFPMDELESVSPGLEISERLVESPCFGADGPGVVSFGGCFLVGPVGGLLPPVPAVSPAGFGLGGAVGVAVLLAGVEESAGGLAFGGRPRLRRCRRSDLDR